MSDVPMKKCTGPCGQEYPATTEFWHKKARGKYGLNNKCKICIREYGKQYRSIPDVSARRKGYRSRPDVRKREKERQKVYMKQYRSALDVKQHEKEYWADYYQRDGTKEKKRVHINNYYARKQSIMGAHTPQQIREQLKRQGCKCYYAACGHAEFKKKNGRYLYHIEHTFPLSRLTNANIPANSIEYLVLACPKCNLSKGDKFPWEWFEGGRLLSSPEVSRPDLLGTTCLPGKRTEARED